jgi:hypothetical protein
MCLASAASAQPPPEPRAALWQAVEEAVAQGLPRTAIERLEPILAAALAEGAHDEAFKALARKIALEGNLEGNRPEELIRRLEAARGEMPAALHPLIDTLLGHWTWDYFQRNRWRFHQRGATSEAPGEDLESWDLPRILGAIDAHFRAALADEATLQALPVTAFEAVLVPGQAPDAYRPTLFDFLAHEALEFYQAGEQAALVGEDGFLVEASSPALDTAEAFLAWELPGSSDYSPELRALRLYQRLLAFHADDADRTAFFDADLARLHYAYNVAVGEDDEERYAAALEHFIAAAADHEISSRALAELATLRQRQGRPDEAHVLARRGRDAFPGSVGGARCHNLLQQIEAKSVDLTTERVWNAAGPELEVVYRNLEGLHFRAVRAEFREELRQSRWGFGRLDRDRRREILARRPDLTWSAALPPTPDFRERRERLPAPEDLEPGFYHLLASADPDFRETDNVISHTTVWVSDLALLLRSGSEAHGTGGRVLAARSGLPLEDARVRFWERGRNGHWRSAGNTRSDAEGRFSLPSAQGNYLVLAEYQGDSLASAGPLYRPGPRDDRTAEAETRTVFFTDRALYRPGQSIHYKGVALRHDEVKGRYDALDGEPVTVVFTDPNGEEIARTEHTTNAFGSFSGVFIAPRDRLTGEMTLEALDPEGETTVQVEEYKRPKFVVELPAPDEAPRLAAPVALTGKAEAYTGAAIGGASVRWRVERGVRLPPWFWWWQPPPPQAIAHGSAETAPDGTFRLEFPATPDRSVPASQEPVFSYTVHVDVTDTTGETRSATRTFRVGYTALAATLTAADWQTTERPVALTLGTQTLDGDPQTARGTLTVHALEQPAAVPRATLSPPFWRWQGATEPPTDPSRPESWPLAEAVVEQPFTTDASGQARLELDLAPGIYRATLATEDRFGRAVSARHTFEVFDPEATHRAVKLPNLLAAPAWSVEPGETFTALWGTGYAEGRAFVEVLSAGRLLQSYWTEPGRTQALIRQPVTEAMRGGFTLQVTFVRENRAYLEQRQVAVPWTNKQLTVAWETFRSKLTPGASETWTATIRHPDGAPAAAELVAALYDASLDQFLPHSWPDGFGVFRREWSGALPQFQNSALGFNHLAGSWERDLRSATWSYRRFDPAVRAQLWGYGFPRTRGMPMRAMAPAAMESEEVIELSPFSIEESDDRGYLASETLAGTRLNTELKDVAASISVVQAEFLDDTVSGSPPPDLSQVTARRNLAETAFFFPHLTSGEDGAVTLRFTVPEALTAWKFLGFAHDAELRAGGLVAIAVTAKDLMVEPNPPRFLREGDEIEFTVKVSNQTDAPQSGRVRLSFADASTLDPREEALGLATPTQEFEIPARQARTLSWRLRVPDGLGWLTYKAVGASASSSDGEEGFLPVLPRRLLVTESLPLPLRGAGTREFTFAKLLASGDSDSLRHESLTVQMVSQPAWYAVMALPYLMEFPHACSEQVFNRLYANTLAAHLAQSDPKIARVFEQWKNTPALDSPLEQNEDLKSVLLEETPWVRQAKDESAARRRLGLLFDRNRLADETARSLRELADRQLDNGLWPWFPGGREDAFISLYIATGFGRLRHLGVEIDAAPAVRALDGIDAWMAERHRRILQRPDPEDHVPAHLEALYLYGRSFFLADRPVAASAQPAWDFFLRQAARHWLRLDCRQCQGHLALALHRTGEVEAAQAIMRSIRERALHDEEMGMFWRDLEGGWWWWRAPIETQAVMIEAFDEVMDDAEAVEACKVWLLKQKQTQDWKTTKATADAVYALLRRGENLLASDALVEVELGGETVQPERVEAGTGFYQHRFTGSEVRPAMGEITTRKSDAGVSWGAVHWQYLEDVSRVTPHSDTPLRLTKSLHVRETTAAGPVLRPVDGPLSVGDELVVRLELRSDRDLEYVHLKDQRGSGTEPVNVLSGHRFRDGLAYYESTRDTASHFFIAYLPKGTYVLEYSLRVQLRGRYPAGLATLQCMYAPEFNSHSASQILVVE